MRILNLLPIYSSFLVVLGANVIGDGSQNLKNQDSNAIKAHNYRSKKTISLFNIVSFPNIECLSTDPNKKKGVCYSLDECQNLGGTSAGRCAAGFGVCCTFSVNNCGSSITRNLTFIQNPGFPQVYNPAQVAPCSYTIQKVNDNICLLRLDFETLKTSEPADGMCGQNNFDQVTFLSPGQRNPPGPGGICGSSVSEQHLYMNAMGTGPSMIQFTIGSQAVNNRMWNIRVSQIECNSPSRPPLGCDQYFMDVSGTFKSYNFDGGLLLSGQETSYCFRQNRGFCSIEYTTSMDDSFSLFGDQTKSQDNTDPDGCKKAALIFLSTSNVKGNSEFCGGKFNEKSVETVNGIIKSSTAPFMVSLRTTSNFANNNMKGFSLSYRQVPCL